MEGVRMTLVIAGVLLTLGGIISFLFVPIPRWGTFALLAAGACSTVIGMWVLD